MHIDTMLPPGMRPIERKLFSDKQGRVFASLDFQDLCKITSIA